MDGFLNWFFSFMTTMLEGLYKIVSGIFFGVIQIFNLPAYFEQFASYSRSFTILDWVLAILGILIVFGIWAIIIVLIVLGLRKYIRFRKSLVGQEDVLEELADLHRDVVRLTREKERIMALKIGQTSIPVEAINEIFAASRGEGDEYDNIGATVNASLKVAPVNITAAPPVASASPGSVAPATLAPSPITKKAPKPQQDARFFRLSAVDEKYEYYTAPTYRKDLNLEQLCDEFRNFACTSMGLYYEQKTIRLMFAGLASTKLILLQGISGTGKTSLPYAMGKFFKNDATIASVQPSWRDRTELFGYFNEFTKRFNETEVLRRIYEASYNDDINIIVLDEMNIARVEYYFAEMLSVLEMPDSSEWNLELVPSSWDSDPKHLKDGRLFISQNIWFVGTANNDDSTFSVSDKVYDRAMTINLDSKGVPFEAPETGPSSISYTYVEQMYQDAIEAHPVSQDYLHSISMLDMYVIQKFRVAFGNRIMKQLQVFVPVYVACGGDEVDGIDYILATKVFRKFESLNLSLIREEIDGLIAYLHKTFGRGKMQECIAYLERLKRTY